MVQINWTRTAVADLKSIHDFIAKDSRKYATIKIIKIKSRTKILKKRPLCGREVPEKSDCAIRELIEGN